MSDWNEQSAPNNNLTPSSIRSSKLVGNNKQNHEFSEELSDSGVRDKVINWQRNKRKSGNS
ncbi:hypothetical protein [Niallia endozanthoxylica]|uniref:Uncharacterized protein n=1 Tax=Niallia endozanthoxylica TaxID=2036016 RepID=A0A5J5HRZ5_9BACI|nr:hypothetical protein [Niallia endozanthoxylica]KAA9023602.1 hypothetical protein F4V44_13145 [Niallia endozanthoxylica]